MKLKTSRFGEIDVPDQKIINFEYGVIGFEDDKQFSVIKHSATSSFFWLQSLSDPELAFSLLNPYLFVPGFDPKLKSKDLAMIGEIDINDYEFYGMVVIPKNPSQMTINLLSPIVINPKSQKGIQIILTHTDYKVNHFVIPQKDSEKTNKKAV